MASPPPTSSVESLSQALEQAVGSRYRVLRLLGRGGMGTVFLAREEALERLVAVKLLHGGTSHEQRERFRREARLAAGLTHPNIVPLHAFGEAEGTVYLVMEYVRGEPLSERLRRERRLEAGEVRRILVDLAEALDHAHRRGIVHRDVKPENVLLEDESGRAILADFGIARPLDDAGGLTQTGSFVGTPAYASPEQAAGQAVDGRSDLYALGMVGYVMLSGRLPFAGETPQAALVRRLTEEAPGIAAAAPGVPADLAAAIDRCLARDPAARFPDARAFRNAIGGDHLGDDQLPEPLDALDGMAAQLAPLAVALAVVLAWGFALLRLVPAMAELGGLTGLAIVWSSVLGGLLLIQLPIALSAALASQRRGFSLRAIAGAVLRQPRWWIAFWYPRPWRRRDDVWARLPAAVRGWRVTLTLLVGSLVAGTFCMPCVLLAVGEGDHAVARALLGHLFLCLWLTFFASGLSVPVWTLLCTRLLAGSGLDAHARRRAMRVLLLGPTSDRAPWRRPEVARALQPVAAQPASAPPATPHACLAAIVDLAPRLHGGNGEREATLEAGRGLVRRIDTLEAEVTALGETLPGAEMARLEAQLAALPTGAAEEDELRDLLVRQLALLRRRAVRVEAAQQEKQRAVDLLHGLYRALRQQVEQPGSGRGDLSSLLAAAAGGPGPAEGAASLAADPDGATKTSVALKRA